MARYVRQSSAVKQQKNRPPDKAIFLFPKGARIMRTPVPTVEREPVPVSKKRGRPPIGDKAMLPAERKAKYLAAHPKPEKQEQEATESVEGKERVRKHRSKQKSAKAGAALAKSKVAEEGWARVAEKHRTTRVVVVVENGKRAFVRVPDTEAERKERERKAAMLARDRAAQKHQLERENAFIKVLETEGQTYVGQDGNEVFIKLTAERERDEQEKNLEQVFIDKHGKKVKVRVKDI